MTLEDEVKFNAPPTNVASALSIGKGRCEKVSVTTADGRRFDLGRPDSLFFQWRVHLYKWRRRAEFKGVSNG